jgi:hypothetical protein
MAMNECILTFFWHLTNNINGAEATDKLLHKMAIDY